MIDVIDLQKKVKLDKVGIREFCDTLCPVVPGAAGRPFTVAFIDDTRMKQLNELFRGKDQTTDVLSFPHEADPLDPDNKTLGDIVVSAEQAQKQAEENELTLEAEIKQLILHGLLHLCGYDHETDNGEMNALELELREKLAV
jgi:probable rRNA maturation factor